jgi:energy-coupling factor transporter transmembrane protein EcfT
MLRLEKFTVPELVVIALTVSLNFSIFIVFEPLLTASGIPPLPIIVPVAMMYTLCRFLVNKFGTLTLSLLIFSILAIPTAVWGPFPGPYKIPIALVAGLITDTVMSLTRNRSYVFRGMCYSVNGLVMMPLMTGPKIGAICSRTNSWTTRNTSPVTKLTALFLAMFIAFVGSDKIIVVTCTVLLVALVWKGKSIFKEYLALPLIGSSLKLFFVLPVVAFGVYWLAYQDLNVALANVVVFLCRLGILLVTIFFFAGTTSQRDLIRSLKALKIPHEFAFMLSLAMRSLPVAVKDLRNILDAQRSRAYKFKVWNLHAMFIPAVLLLLTRSLEISLSMEAKGFRSGKGYSRSLSLSTADHAAIVGATLVAIVIFLFFRA